MKAIAVLTALAALVAVIHLDDAPPEAELTFVNRVEVFTLDPQRMSWLHDFRTAYAVYEGLVRWNTADFSIVPAAASEWSVSADGLTWTFPIRPDAKWSNGDPVTAADFIYSWRRAILPDTAADYSAMFFAIAGAEAFFRWRAEALAAFAARGAADPRGAADLWAETERRFTGTVGLRSLDERTLQVTLARPVPYFLDLLAFGVFLPVHRPTVEGFCDLDPATGRLRQRHGWTRPPHFVCNGPYVVRQWRYKRGLHLERNPFYHDPDLARASTIACLSIEDVNTAILAFESGRIDWLTEVSAGYEADMLAERSAYERRYAAEIGAAMAAGRTIDEALAALPPPETGERRNIHVFPTFGTDFYSFNCRPQLPDGRPNPFSDARVRRAFVMSIDRSVIVRQVTRLNEPVQGALVPAGSIAGYDPPQGLPHDPARARAELRAAGWERGADGRLANGRSEPFPVVDLLYSTNTSRYKNISLALRDMWQRELGAQVELRGKENKFFKEDLKHGNFMVGRGGWYGDYGDPTTYLDMCRTGDGNNDRAYSNPQVDRLLDEASVEPDAARRLLLLRECERIIVEEDVPMLVLCQHVQVYMYEPGELTGLSAHPRLTQYLWQLEVNPR